MDKSKVKVYIDGANMFYAQKKLGWVLDWAKIKKSLEEKKEVLNWHYYVSVKEDDEKMQRYLRYLAAIGFNALTKPLKKIKISRREASPENCGYDYIYKANFDVEMTADILLDKSGFNEVIIFSGDSDFEYLAKRLKDIGKKVVVYSSRKTLSWELKLVVHKYVYLEDNKDIFARK